MVEQEGTRPDASGAAETRQKVIDALREAQRPMTDLELASAADRDIEVVRETLTALHREGVVDLTYQADQRDQPPTVFPEEPDSPPDQMIARLAKQ